MKGDGGADFWGFYKFYILCLAFFLPVVAGTGSGVTFTLGSTNSKISVVEDEDYLYDTWEVTQCGVYFTNLGSFESEHPFMPKTACMYNVTANEKLEVRIPKLEIKETYRCIEDNVQIYSGSDLLDWICETQNKYSDEWVKIDSNQFGVYFEGQSRQDLYGFKLEWRPETPPTTTTVTTTTTTTTTITIPTIKTTTTKKTASKKKNKYDISRNGKKLKRPKRPEVKSGYENMDLVALIKHKYEKILSIRTHKNGKNDRIPLWIARFQKMVNHMFHHSDRNQHVRRCIFDIPAIPDLYRNQVEKTNSTQALFSLLKEMRDWQTTECNRKTSQIWLPWLDRRTDRFARLESENLL